MIDVRVIEEYYLKSFNQISKKAGTNVTTVYDFSIFKDLGVNVLNKKLYSKFLPSMSSLSDFLNKDPDILCGFYSAFQSFVNDTSQSYLTEISTSNGRVTKFNPLLSKYWLSVTYDRDMNNYFFIETFMNKLVSKAIQIIDTNNLLFKHHETTGALSLNKINSNCFSSFEDLGKELVKVFDVGYNNRKVISYINNLEKIKNNSLNEIVTRKATETYEELRNLIKKLPNIENDLLNIDS